MPLVNEVVVPVGDKDFWNASQPKDDLGNFGSYITNPELPTLIQAIYGITPAPPTPRNDLVQVFATGNPRAQPAAGRGPQRDDPPEHVDPGV